MLSGPRLRKALTMSQAWRAVIFFGMSRGRGGAEPHVYFGKPGAWLLCLAVNQLTPNSKTMKLMQSALPLCLTKTTLNNGYLGSRNDEERSEMRYVV